MTNKTEQLWNNDKQKKGGQKKNQKDGSYSIQQDLQSDWEKRNWNRVSRGEGMGVH